MRSDIPSRREIIVGAAGAVVALGAQALAQPLGVAAADGEQMVVGGEYESDTRTHIGTNTADPCLFIQQRASGTAINAEAQGGPGIWAYSYSGPAVRAESDTSFGLEVRAGRIKATQVSGVATIAAGARSRTVRPPVGIVDGSFVLLTPRVNLGSRGLWYTTNPSANAFTIHISSPRSGPTKVAWLLLG